MSALVSVIVPCHNYGRFLTESVESVFKQSHREWECIVVDDGSTDATSEIGRRLALRDSRVHYLRQANHGLSAARNAGIRHAKGEFVQFLDADDLLESHKLMSQLNQFQLDAKTDIVIGDAAFFPDAQPACLRERRPRLTAGSTAEQTLAALVMENVCVVNAALVRRTVFDAVGLFDETLQAHEDWDFWLRCALAGCRFSVSSDLHARALVRVHSSSMSASRERMVRTAMTVRERIAAVLPVELQAVNLEYLSQIKSRFGLALVRAGRVSEGWTLYQDGLRSSRSKALTLMWLVSLVPGVMKVRRWHRKLRGASMHESM